MAAPDTTPSALLDRARASLEEAGTLHAEMAAALRRGDAAAIDVATSRLQTLVLEFKLVAEEVARAAPSASPDPELARAREAFEATALRLARESAVSGGLLSRLVQFGRRLSAALDSACGAPYLSSGRCDEPGRRGYRLEETR